MASLRKHPVVCIAGTDTDAGKTHVTAGLLRALSLLDHQVQGIKAVQTGCLPGPGGKLAAPDVSVYREAAAKVPAEALCCLRAACSPHLAAGLEGRTLAAGSLASAIVRAADAFSGITLVEGAGGLFVPLNKEESLLDVFALLGAPLVLAAPNRLGTVNHTLLSLAALRQRNIPVLAVVLTDAPAAGQAASPLAKRMLDDNPRIISLLGDVPTPLRLPWLPGFHGRQESRDGAWDALSAHLLSLAREIPLL